MSTLSDVNQIILILSGKGGVGKSTLSTQLALSLQSTGKKVGLLDIDICGPSIPQMLGLNENEIQQGENGWIPVKKGNLSVMSIAFLLKSKNDAVIWRGPKKHSMIKQFMTDVFWDELDFLIIDTPPGTSDEHISIVEYLQNYQEKTAAILITSPQLVAVGDVRREITFCEKTKVKCLGIVENFSSFECPNCKHCTSIFPNAGGELLAKESGIQLLGKIPIDHDLAKCGESGENFIENYSKSPSAIAVNSVRDLMLQQLSN